MFNWSCVTLVFDTDGGMNSFLHRFAAKSWVNFDLTIFVNFGGDDWTLWLYWNVGLILRFRTFSIFCSMWIIIDCRHKVLRWFRLPQFCFSKISIPRSYRCFLTVDFNFIFFYLFHYHICFFKEFWIASLTSWWIKKTWTWSQIWIEFIHFFNGIN